MAAIGLVLALRGPLRRVTSILNGKRARSTQGLHGDRDPGRGGEPAKQAEDQRDPREQRRPQAGQDERDNGLGALGQAAQIVQRFLPRSSVETPRLAAMIA
jgi:hypothetical protein